MINNNQPFIRCQSGSFCSSIYFLLPVPMENISFLANKLPGPGYFVKNRNFKVINGAIPEPRIDMLIYCDIPDRNTRRMPPSIP